MTLVRSTGASRACEGPAVSVGPHLNLVFYLFYYLHDNHWPWPNSQSHLMVTDHCTRLKYWTFIIAEVFEGITLNLPTTTSLAHISFGAQWVPVYSFWLDLWGLDPSGWSHPEGGPFSGIDADLGMDSGIGRTRMILVPL